MMQEASWVVILKRLYNIILHSMDHFGVGVWGVVERTYKILF